ncbi:unnamed protein product [Paramecium sonneborni]|uniref:CBM20 domain-containing protein n=1 Tax=Paramecium sonneborni TaxID=65129 RepID=A0A8S1LUS1_9CILI|nr:unnamed protein product [Paramecium sonneborni]
MAIKLNFKVRCETTLSESVCIVGSVKELGLWNPSNSLQLSTNPDIYPFWVGNICVDVNENQLIEFKAIITQGHQVNWEDSDNRVIQIRYQSQSIIFSFNSQLLQVIRIQSLYDLSDDESINLDKIKKIKLQNVLNPYDQEGFTSESDQESDHLSNLDSAGFSPILKSLSIQYQEESFELLVHQ